MKLRILAVLLIVTLAAWLPLAARQSAPTSQAPATPQDSGKSPAKPACCCCDHKAQQDKGKAAGAPDHSAMTCCQGKDAKAMACCGKDSKDAKASMDCCKDKDAKMCAKDGKSCCGSGDAKDGKSCCGKDALACNSKDAKDCCASASDCCAAHTHAS
jgi:hypothetical protein